MSLDKDEVWADLRYAYDELYRWFSPSRASQDLDKLSDDEFFDRFPTVGVFAREYRHAETRAGIRKGLKAILLDGGVPLAQARKRGHQLHLLLEDVKCHNPTAFSELERCFEIALQFLEFFTTPEYVSTYRTDILDYFQKHGKGEVFITNRYMSLEGNVLMDGMIGHFYFEIIRALMALIYGGTPKDLYARIEDATAKAVLAESRHDPSWDAEEWLNRGPVRPRLEDIENLANHKVLRLAVRRCARESRDRGISDWARVVRRSHFAKKGNARYKREHEREMNEINRLLKQVDGA